MHHLGDLIAASLAGSITMSCLAPRFWRWLTRQPTDAMRFDRFVEEYRVTIWRAGSDARDALDRGDTVGAHAALDRILGAKL